MLMVPSLRTATAVAGFVVCGRNAFRTQALSLRDKSPIPLRDHHHQQQQQQLLSSTVSESTKNKKSLWLVVGDGDLSYSASIANDLAKANIQLVATVLEKQDVHERVYKRSKENSQSILSCSQQQYHNDDDDDESHHQVHFGVDATKLEQIFSSSSFDCIEFNFPHWRGKTNNRYNRQLLSDFLQSASKVIQQSEPNGEIRVALCEGQGGMPADSLSSWKQSWMAAMYAASHGLLLRRMEPFDPDYFLSSHRGVDRPFSIGTAPQKYTFTLPNGKPIDEDLQISCRHELRIIIHDEDDETIKKKNCPVSLDDIIHGDAVIDLARQFVPKGIRLEVPAREILSAENKLQKTANVRLAVFLLNYSGESEPLSRETADTIRANIESAIIDTWHLDIAKAGRMVSKPYPYTLLPKLLEEYNR
eukprot:scaffold4025_cov106-Cylindrotheca_fusiformis.AAC.4